VQLEKIHRSVVVPGVFGSVCVALAFAVDVSAAEMQVLPNRVADLTSHLQPLSSLRDETRLNLAIILPLRNQSALTNYLRELYDPKSPNFHRYLTPFEFADQFGPAVQDYDALVKLVESSHLKVTHAHPNRTILDVSASVADIRRVFHANINVYQHPAENRTFYAPDTAPTTDLGVPILTIKGLDNFNQPQPDPNRASPAPVAPAPMGGSGPGGLYLGTNFRAAYVPGVTLTGTGQTAAVVAFDDYYPSDIAAYDAYAGLPGVTLSNVMVDGFSGPPSFQDDQVSADIEVLSAMAPGLSRILVYEEDRFSPVDDLLNQIATDDSASQISCSWSFLNADAATDQIFQQFALQGQSFFCASGSSGAYSPTNVPSPVGSPYITVVGGTVLNTGSRANWTSEAVWNGSGGGFTTNYTIPDWQAGVNMTANQGSTVYRNIPDVAMCASNIYVIYHSFNAQASESFRGTGVSAPLWAGFTALVNEQASASGDAPVGFLNPAIYAIGASAAYATNFHDITSGSSTNTGNGMSFSAVTGYDLCTGWGTPYGSNLINTLAPPDSLIMLPVSGFAATGPVAGPFSVTNETFLLTNKGTVAVTWALGKDASWISVAPTNGVLAGGTGTNVVVSFSSAAASLPLGDYAAHLAVTNLNTGNPHQRTFTLHVSDPLIVTASPGLEFGGPPGGPFNILAQVCTLTNTSLAPISWAWAGGASWLNISPDHGTLPVAASAQVTCSLNPTANNLAAGIYTGSVLFTNLTDNALETVPANLNVGQLLLNGGFETGDFTGWSRSGDFSYTGVITNASAVHSGSFGASLGTSGFPGYLAQNLPTTPGQSFVVSLWLGDADGLVPNGLVLSWGGIILCQLTNLPVMNWTNLQFVVPATNATTLLQIQFQDDLGYLSVDDVSVTAAPPTISGISPSRGPAGGGTSVTVTGTGFQNHAAITFGSFPAASVTVQSTTNLVATTPAMPVGLTNLTLINGDGQSAVLSNAFTFVGTPTITWPPPPSLAYGAALDGTRLDAGANVPGAFAYSPSAGTALASGTTQLSVIFTPTDTNDYYTVTNYTGLVVTLAPLNVTASNATRFYGLTNPVFTGNISGLQYADNISATYTSSATSATLPSSVPIVPQLSDPDHRLTNYQVSIVDGSLTILAAAPPVFQTFSRSGGSITLIWSTIPQESYQVQYSSTLFASNWANFTNAIIATNSTAAITDTLANSHRYYRVLLVPQ
jgi:hypothetical protein